MNEKLGQYYTLSTNDLIAEVDELFHDCASIQTVKEEIMADSFPILDNENGFYAKNSLRNLLILRPDLYPYLREKQFVENYEFMIGKLDDEITQLKTQGGSSRKIQLKTEISLLEDRESVSVQIPIPIEGDLIQSVNIDSCSNENYEIAPNNTDQRTLLCHSVNDQKQFFVKFSYTIQSHYHPLDEKKVTRSNLLEYMSEEGTQIIFSDRLKELVKSIVGSEKNELKKARLIYNYITQNIQYSLMRPYQLMGNILEYALDHKKGDCGVQSLLFITMCRIAKIPARWQSGYYVNPHYVGYHDWARIHIAPYGWIHVDPAYGGLSLVHQRENHWNFYFGNVDTFRCVTANGFEKEFHFSKKFDRYDPYDNQAGEIEDDVHGLWSDEYQTKVSLIKNEA